MPSVPSHAYPEQRTIRTRRRVRVASLSLFVNAPTVLTIEAITPTSVRVTFAQPVINNVALRNPAHYTIAPIDSSPAVTVLGVSVESSTQILLATSEMRQNAPYRLTITTIERA